MIAVLAAVSEARVTLGLLASAVIFSALGFATGYAVRQIREQEIRSIHTYRHPRRHP